MARLSITLTEKAYEIYCKIKSHERSKFVSDAIIEKHNSGAGTQQQIDELRGRIEKLERGKGKWK